MLDDAVLAVEEMNVAKKLFGSAEGVIGRKFQAFSLPNFNLVGGEFHVRLRLG